MIPSQRDLGRWLGLATMASAFVLAEALMRAEATLRTLMERGRDDDPRRAS